MDALQAKKLKEIDGNITALEIAIRGEGNSRVKAELKRQLKKQEELRDGVKKAVAEDRIPLHAGIGEVGKATGGVMAVIDGNTAVLGVEVVKIDGLRTESRLLLTNYPTKNLKSRMTFESPDLFRVVSVTTDNSDALIVLGKSYYRVVEPIKKADVQRYRAMYDAELAAKAAVPPAQ